MRFGIVGSRFIANVHALAISQVPGAELAAAVQAEVETEAGDDHSWPSFPLGGMGWVSPSLG